MKYSIKRKSNNIRKTVFGSALLLVSAFAVLFTPTTFAAEKNKSQELPDSVFTARYVFENIHVPALEILPKSKRLDMLDYWDVDSVYKASNAMEGLSWIEALSPDYMKIRITSASEVEIKILPIKHGKLSMIINTIGDDVQAQDSHVSFYNENFQELSTEKYLEMPAVKDFFYIPKGSATKMKEIDQMIPFPTVAFSADADSNNLEARLTVEKFINEDDWNIAKLFYKPVVVLEWNKDKFRILKK